MPKIKVNGINVFYESRGNGYPLIFTHGFSASHLMWKAQESITSKYRLINYDARGHGETDSPPSADQYSADICVEDLYQLARALDVQKAVFGGLSMGGYLSLRFYLRHSEMVSALIIMDTGPGYRNPIRMTEWNRLREEMAQRLEKDGISILATQAQSEGRREISLKQNPIGLANMSRKVVAQHDSWVIENLDKVKVPTLILVGEKDSAFLQAADYMAKTIPDARKFIVPHAGHASNIDNPQFFNARILEFLHNVGI